jgi:hypothetical protein
MAESLIGGFLYSGFEKPGKYPYINVEQTESGHFIMMDDTPGNESIQIQHGKVFYDRQKNPIKTYWKIDPTGSTSQVTAGNNFTVIVNNNNVTIGGVCHVNIEADAKLAVYGDVLAEVGGSIKALVPNGSVNVIAGGEVDIVANQGVNIVAGNAASLNPLTAPDINLITGGAVNITGDLQVSGSIRGGASINATTHLTAGYKCFTLGGFETLGGMNVGFTTPGPVLPLGVLNAATVINAPVINGAFVNGGLVNGLMVKDVMGFMAILRMTYNTHVHPSYRGPTGFPIKPDVGGGGSSPGAPSIPGLQSGGVTI